MFWHAGKEVMVVFYFSTITRHFAVMVIAITVKAHGPRQVGLHCYSPCSAVSCAGLFLEYFELHLSTTE